MGPSRGTGRTRRHTPHRIAVRALDGLIPFEFGIPQRIFGRARDATGARLYEVVTCAVR